MPNPVKVFVYGSLREGEYNNGRFGPQKNLGLYTSPTGYVLINLGAYPAMVQTRNPHTRVVGEIHEITPDMLPWFDRMEYGAGYHRVVEEFDPVGGQEGPPVMADVYVQPYAHWMKDKIIPSGDWKKR